MGRSKTQQCGGDGTISETKVCYGNHSWVGYSVKATPALAVEHAVVELADRSIALAVSGINYGENIGSCVTVSGTVGAALEAADKGIPALAVSQEIDGLDYRSYSKKVNFSAAVHFTHQISEKILKNTLPFDADVLKMEIPISATADTECFITRQDRLSYYTPVIQDRENQIEAPARVYHTPGKGSFSKKDTDAYALAQGWVSITPLSFDLTSRITMSELADILETSIL
jgi:5'-nucleotidase